MIRNFSFILILLFASATIFAGKSDKQYGKELTVKETTPVSNIMENPKNYLGKKVKIEGTIVDVCSKRGCWIDVSGDKPYQKIKVKVNDGEIVFPMESKGKKIVVEGEIYELLTDTEHSPELKHEGENHKEGEDSCEHSTEKKPKTVYQIKGLGAIIKE